MTEMSVGVRELKAHLSEYLREVKNGQIVVITEHGREVARLMPVGQPVEERLQALVAAGLGEWSGERLPPVPHRPRVKGARTVADLLIEDRE
jgi:prevent-host-death family protein